MDAKIRRREEIAENDGLDFKAAKQRVYDAMVAWVADVKAGVVTLEDEARHEVEER